MVRPKRRKWQVFPGWLRRTDRAVSGRAYSWPSPRPADVALRGLSDVPGSFAFWLGLGAAVFITGRTGRRAAAQGLLSLGVSSGVVNLLVKRVIREHRPHGRGFRHRRKPGTVPASAALPSGHSATAAAFAAGVWLADRRRGAVIVPVAATVAYSRLHLGQHWFSDIMAGSAVGVAVAVILHRIRLVIRRDASEHR
ncbi:phosphatase PAP2 family protein [Curtobacterium sp. Leaf261]|uniref:phosphatase PAP2 family protein n=1 Tax=Curtobacterium sp. Leaf261 TaxID=1736311 RepID=UPI003FA44B52